MTGLGNSEEHVVDLVRGQINLISINLGHSQEHVVDLVRRINLGHSKEHVVDVVKSQIHLSSINLGHSEEHVVNPAVASIAVPTAATIAVVAAVHAQPILLTTLAFFPDSAGAQPRPHTAILFFFLLKSFFSRFHLRVHAESAAATTTANLFSLLLWSFFPDSARALAATRDQPLLFTLVFSLITPPLTFLPQHMRSPNFQPDVSASNRRPAVGRILLLFLLFFFRT